jgi:hypothetical protein
VAGPESPQRLWTHLVISQFLSANHRAFFILMALFAPVDRIDTLLKGVPHFLAQGPQYIVGLVLYTTGLTIAAITCNERYHQFYAVFFLVQTVVISFIIFHTLI